jgi:hypothetical protein
MPATGWKSITVRVDFYDHLERLASKREQPIHRMLMTDYDFPRKEATP